jgi:hypothetical protein
MFRRLLQNGVENTCAGKLFPGTVSFFPSVISYMISSPFTVGTTGCVTVTVTFDDDGTCTPGSIFPVTYRDTILGNFSPAFQAVRYIDDPGSITGPFTWSFTLLAGQRFVLVYEQVSPLVPVAGCQFETCIDFP